MNTQSDLIESARASIVQLEKSLAQLTLDYQRQLHAERGEVQGELDRLAQERAKQSHRRQLLELRAGQDSVVKDLATHSIGTVVQPGTVLLTLVPVEDTLRAEVWVNNEDIGFVRKGQAVRLKFAAFRFQKYGMVEGRVEHISADATDAAAATSVSNPEVVGQTRQLGYKALVALEAMHLDVDGEKYALAAGMQSTAEILLGTRSVAEYLLSPVSKAWHEAGRER